MSLTLLLCPSLSPTPSLCLVLSNNNYKLGMKPLGLSPPFPSLAFGTFEAFGQHLQAGRLVGSVVFLSDHNITRNKEIPYYL